MNELSEPIIYETKYDIASTQILDAEIKEKLPEGARFLLDFPTVYIINSKKKKNRYSVYIGETNNIKQRTQQHLLADPKKREDFAEFVSDEDALMYVIGHDHFNKSLTLDIENRLMHYLSSIENVDSVYNRRSNQQADYYTSQELDDIFAKIWQQLVKHNSNLFPMEQVIKDSAVFKASPFHKLTDEQIKIKDRIMLRILEALTNTDKEGQLILVTGEAGSGKTVLLSSIFYELYLEKYGYGEEPLSIYQDLSAYLIINHDQQLKVYQDIARKLGLLKTEGEEIVGKPTRFINSHSSEDKVDVILIDEAHLLWTQGKQSYRGKHQLRDLLDRAKVVIAILDMNQILSTESYIEQRDYSLFYAQAKKEANLLELKNQMRISADADTVAWIRNIVDERTIGNIPADEQGYDICIFDDPAQMHQEIKAKAINTKQGLTRMVATFDWPYIDKKRPEDEDYWCVSVGDWKLPWNLQLPAPKDQRLKNRHLSWAEQSHTIDEIGSTFTVQGFDLNYVGVVIGPSVKFRNGQIIFDKNVSHNQKATRNRTLSDGSKDSFADMLLRNELNVLLTRGVNGLYIYAVDDELRAELQKAQRGNIDERINEGY